MNRVLTLLIFAACLTSGYSAAPQQATLLQDELFSITSAGKVVGTCRVAKGSPVDVISVDGDKVLVSKSPSSPAWLPKSELKMETAPAAPVPNKDNVLAKGLLALDSIKNTAAAVAPGTLTEKGQAVVNSIRSAATDIVAAKSEEPAKTPMVLDTVPADFHYEKTVIVPGKFAFLALPFEKQMLSGVCAAAAALNTAQYIEPTIELSQDEMFGLYNDRKEGASTEQMCGGLANLGFNTEVIQTRKAKPDAVIAKIKASLESNRPVVAGGNGHVVTLLGFDSAKKKIIGWDQRGMGLAHPDGRRSGMFDVAESEFIAKYEMLLFIQKSDAKPSQDKIAALSGVVGNSHVFNVHTLVNSNARAEKMPKFAEHAIPPLVKMIMRSGGTVLISSGGKEWLSFPPQKGDVMEYTVFPSGQTKKARFDFIIKAVLDAGGVFYSAGK